MIRFSKLFITALGFIFLLGSCKGDKPPVATSNEEIDMEIEKDIDTLNQVIEATQIEIEALLEDI